MTVSEILNRTDHRPWAMQSGKWTYYQEWNNTLFLHWQVDREELQKFVPEELEIDLFEGQAWVSLVAFTMEQIRPKHLPAFSPVSNFDEINIRTYVKKDGKSGVYFLSIEGGKLLSCKIARSLSELPYRYSIIRRKENSYHSENNHFGDKMHLLYEIGNVQKEKSQLDRWLTERYALFQDTETSINEFEIHHIEWPICEIDLKTIEVNYPRFSHLLNGIPKKTHYSKGVQVIAWNKKTSKRNFIAKK